MKNFFSIICCILLIANISYSKNQNSEIEDIKIVKVNDSNFEKEVLNSDKPVILEISSTSCPPCLVMIPTLISIAKNYSDIKIATVGIDEPGIEKIKNDPNIFFMKPLKCLVFLSSETLWKILWEVEDDTNI